jgi:hypothetical protein
MPNPFLCSSPESGMCAVGRLGARHRGSARVGGGKQTPQVVSFPSATIEASWLGDLCNDTSRFRVVVKDRMDGTLRFTGVLNTMAFKADVDRDGKPGLYLVSYQICCVWMRIFRIVSS